MSAGISALTRKRHIACQAFQLARTGIVFPHDGLGVNHLVHRGFDLGAQPVDARRAALRDHHIAVAIEHQARQSVGFAVHQPVKRFAIQPLAQGKRDAQPMHQQRCIEWIGGIAPDDARGDQRARIDVGVPEELVLVRVHLHRGAGLELGQRSGGGVDFIAEDPQVAGAQATVFAALEFEDGDGHRALF